MAAIADNNEGEAGGSGKGSSKRKRGGKKGAAGEDMGDFYVDDAQPIERLPKARKDDADVQVRGWRVGSIAAQLLPRANALTAVAVGHRRFLCG
jgi:hypothetical protein